MELLYLILLLLSIYFLIFFIIKKYKKGRGEGRASEAENKGAPILQQTLAELNDSLEKTYLYGKTEQEFENFKTDDHINQNTLTQAFDTLFSTDRTEVKTPDSQKAHFQEDEIKYEQYSEPEYEFSSEEESSYNADPFNIPNGPNDLYEEVFGIDDTDDSANEDLDLANTESALYKLARSGIDQNDLLEIYEKLKDIMENDKLSGIQKNKMTAILLKK